MTTLKYRDPATGEFMQIDGLVGAVAVPSGGGGSGSMPYLVVAASNAPQAWKDAATYTCDGTDDDVQINAALVAASGEAGTSGSFTGQAHVLLSPGNFSVRAPIKVASRVWLRGSGRGSTLIKAASGHTAVGSSTSGVVVMEDPVNIPPIPYDLRTVSDLSIHGGSLDLTGFYSRFQQSASSKDDNNLAGQPDATSVLKDIVVASCGREGVHVSFVQSSTSWWIDKVRVWSCGDSGKADGAYAGFYIHGTDCWVSNCDVGSQGYSNSNDPLPNYTTSAVGFDCGGSDNFYMNCIAWTTSGTGFLVRGAKQMLSNCLAHHSKKHGFQITNNRNTLSNCIAYNNAEDGFRTESNNITITGCQSFDDNDSFAVPGRPQSTGYNIASTGTTAGINIVGCSAFGVGMTPVAGKVTDRTNNIQVTFTGDNQNGSAGTRKVVSYRDGLFEGSGAGAPEGKVAAPVGSMYRRTDGTVGASLYIKEIGTGTSGWTAIGGGGAGAGPAAALLSNSAEGGTDGVAISAANSGGASGNAFSSVSSAGGAPTYTATAPIKGTRSFATAAAAAGSSSVYWNSTVVPDAAVYYTRMYLKVDAWPESAQGSAIVMYAKTADAGTQAFRVALNATDGKIRANVGAASFVTGTVALTAGTVYRLETMMNPTSGEIEVRVFAGDGAAPVDVLSVTGTAPGAVRHIEFGRVPTNSGVFAMTFDEVAVGTEGWLGPA